MRPKTILPALEADGTFAYVARQVDLDVAQRVEDLNLPGIGFLSVQKRYYPAGALAPAVLGFVGRRRQGPGRAGEASTTRSSPACRGSGRTSRAAASRSRRASTSSKEPVDGVSLRTTLDREMQYRAQVALQEAVEANDAKSGTVIVMDLRTGDIYAMANYPWFDPNNYGHVATHDPGVCGTSPSRTRSSRAR